MRSLGVAVAAIMALSASAHADVYVTISKSQQEMAVSIDGGPTYRWPVSTGKSGYDTPGGNFNAIRLERVYYSKKYDDAPMPNSVFFYGGYAIHGTLEERRLGNAVSHGCVRLSRANAALLYSEVEAHGLSRTHIRITDAPIYGSAPPMARGYDDGQRRSSRDGWRASQGSYEMSSRRYDAPSPRGYQDDSERNAAARTPRYRGFEQFAVPQGSSPPRIYWSSPAPPPPRGYYNEAEIRRYHRDNGWRGY